MVPEFQVLRCFACETFQVQQVKKAKKWSCKMCGEKQSVVKEFGRGSGADCRRHVQKLNSLRGEMLEEANENAWSRWEEDGECEHSQGHALSSEPQQSAGESRWSKYVETMSALDGDEEEEENVSTERKRFGSQRNIRKRKRGRGTRVGSDRHGDHEDDGEEGQGQGTGAWRCDRGLVKPPARTRTLNSSSTCEDGALSTPPFHSHTPAPPAVSRPTPSPAPSPLFPGHQRRPVLSTGPSASDPVVQTIRRPLANAPNGTSASCPVSKGSQAETKSSKWAMFLTSPSNEDQEEEEEEDGFRGDAHWRGAGVGTNVLPSVGQCGFHSTAGVEEQSRSTCDLDLEKTLSSGFHSTAGVEEQSRSTSDLEKTLSSGFHSTAGVEEQSHSTSDLEKTLSSGFHSTAGVEEQSRSTSDLEKTLSSGFHSTAGVEEQSHCTSDLDLEKTLSSGLVGSLLCPAGHSGLVHMLKSAPACFGFASTTNQMQSPTSTTQTIGQDKPVRHQPPPSKRPRPGLAVGSLFQTDEDFDDTF